MIHNIERIGNFTSSEIYLLTKKDRSGGFGAPALEYIRECNLERKLKRSITEESNAKPLTWGKVCESVAFARLGFEYERVSSESIVHPNYPFWAGSPDVLTADTVGDIKCPITLKSFCTLYECRIPEALRADHKDGEKYYWQLVSNSILTGKPYAELIVFCPYLEDLSEIRLVAADYPGAGWIGYVTDDELPYLVSDGVYQSICVMRFEVPHSDKVMLTELVEKAGNRLLI